MDGRAERIAAVENEMAAWDATSTLASRRATSRRAVGRTRRTTGRSSVFTVRLDPDELAALEARAEAARVRPSVLARNYIRLGLTGRDSDALPGLVDKLADVVAELREVVP